MFQTIIETVRKQMVSASDVMVILSFRIGWKTYDRNPPSLLEMCEMGTDSNQDLPQCGSVRHSVKAETFFDQSDFQPGGPALSTSYETILTTASLSSKRNKTQC